MTKMSSREFNQDVGRAKRAADKGPVIITDRGEPAYVLLNHETYRRLAGKTPSLVDLLYQEGADTIEFDPPRMADDGSFKPADFD